MEDAARKAKAFGLPENELQTSISTLKSTEVQLQAMIDFFDKLVPADDAASAAS